VSTEAFTADLSGVSLHYMRAGHGSRTLVLIHGWPQSGYGWRKVIPPLAEDSTVIAVDLRGVGGSSAPATGYTKESLAGDIHKLVQSLGLRDVHVIGHDLGAQVTYSYARQFSSETRGLAILDMPIPGIDGWEQAASSYPAWHFGFHQDINRGAGVAEALVEGRQALYFRSFIDRVAAHPEAITDGDVEVYAAAYGDFAHLKAGFEMYRAFARDIVDNQRSEGKLTVPLLLAFGERSNAPLMGTVAAGLKAAGAQEVSTAVVIDSGHWPAEEQPAQLVAIIIEFLESISR
jgi:pimeloyl-ACP methyl ester carboxylesterase